MTTFDTLTTHSDEPAIRSLMDELAAAWAAQDAVAFAELYTEDASVVTTVSDERGREAIRASLAAGFASRLKDTTTTETPSRIRFLSDDVAIIDSVSGVALPGEAAARPEMLRRSTWVISRTGGRWLVAAYHNSAIDPS
jgi:uncharacterized protein (TIGR02246 family)